MSRKQIRLAGLRAEAIKGKYTVTCISEKTGLSERRIKQLKASYRLTKEVGSSMETLVVVLQIKLMR